MTKKDKYIETMLLENIDTATKSIKDLYEEIEEIRNLPNDCYGIEIDGEICENKDYKIDLLTNHSHVIGYMECLKAQSTELLNLNTMNDEEFELYLIEQEKIKIHNDTEMERLREYLSIDEDEEDNFDED